MRLEARKYLYDIQRSADLLREFTSGKTFADYAGDAMKRSAVERQFEIIGEAMTNLARIDEPAAADGRLGALPGSRDGEGLGNVGDGTIERRRGRRPVEMPCRGNPWTTRIPPALGKPTGFPHFHGTSDEHDNFTDRNQSVSLTPHGFSFSRVPGQDRDIRTAPQITET